MPNSRLRFPLFRHTTGAVILLILSHVGDTESPTSFTTLASHRRKNALYTV